MSHASRLPVVDVELDSMNTSVVVTGIYRAMPSLGHFCPYLAAFVNFVHDAFNSGYLFRRTTPRDIAEFVARFGNNVEPCLIFGDVWVLPKVENRPRLQRLALDFSLIGLIRIVRLLWPVKVLVVLLPEEAVSNRLDAHQVRLVSSKGLGKTRLDEEGPECRGRKHNESPSRKLACTFFSHVITSLCKPQDADKGQDTACSVIGPIVHVNVMPNETVKIKQTDRHVCTVSRIIALRRNPRQCLTPRACVSQSYPHRPRGPSGRIPCPSASLQGNHRVPDAHITHPAARFPSIAPESQREVKTMAYTASKRICIAF